MVNRILISIFIIGVVSGVLCGLYPYDELIWNVYFVAHSGMWAMAMYIIYKLVPDAHVMTKYIAKTMAILAVCKIADEFISNPKINTISNISMPIIGAIAILRKYYSLKPLKNEK